MNLLEGAPLLLTQQEPAYPGARSTRRRYRYQCECCGWLGAWSTLPDAALAYAHHRSAHSPLAATITVGERGEVAGPLPPHPDQSTLTGVVAVGADHPP